MIEQQNTVHCAQLPLVAALAGFTGPPGAGTVATDVFAKHPVDNTNQTAQNTSKNKAPIVELEEGDEDDEDEGLQDALQEVINVLESVSV